MTKAIILRFVRAFIAGGISSLAIQLSTMPAFSTFTELKTWTIVAGAGFISGGLMALDKILRYN
jgi:hypothetical protein